MRLLVLTFLLLASPAFAKPRVSSGASSARSVTPTADCFLTAVNGRYENDCWNDHEADGCVGLRLALENSQKRDRCFARAGEGCLVHGHLQNSQAQWIGVAAGYLEDVRTCVRSQYGGGESSGYAEAMADPRFRDRLRGMADGAEVFGLKSGNFLERTLQGESFGDILASSPLWKEIDARERDRMLAAAENSSAPVEVATPTNAPRTLGSWEGSPAIVIHSVANAKPAEMKRAPASAPVVTGYFVRRLQHNPYSLGLDLSLFDRVSTAYQKRSPALRGVEEYIKRLPKREPRDVRDLLGGNRAVDI